MPSLARPWVLCTLVLSACNDHPIKPVEYGLNSEEEIDRPISVNRDVDILFVIDNSGSMAEEQATLARNFGAFIGVLEEDDVDANYRIAVTTTDNGHPRCGATSPEAGAFVLESCRDRLEQFQSLPGTPEPVDARVPACEALCPAELAGLEVLPTALEPGALAQARPWMERTAGLANLPEGVDTALAFACFGPQGIAGCGYESQLESMRKALVRAQTPDDRAYGFVREHAMLAVVFLTDEADCSTTPDLAAAAFDPQGESTLWGPGADGPTSAICWNAGTECTGGPGQYDECHSVDRALDGSVTTDPDQAVLTPLDRYVELLQAIEDAKREDDANANAEVLVSVVTGVPHGYPDAPIPYADGTDAQFLADYGIGVGCTSADGTAVPPVRLRELAEQFTVEGANNLFSICDADYSEALRTIADIIGRQLQPACFPECVADKDPIAPGLQPLCSVKQTTGGEDSEPIARCVQDGTGTWALPDGVDTCFWEASGTELDLVCSEAGYNLEIRLVQRPGVPVPQGRAMRATCSLSAQSDIDCPSL